jgi:hypothetical protein
MKIFMKLVLSLFLVLFSNFSSADMDWCSYEKESREPTRNESQMCPAQKIGSEYSKSLDELDSIISIVQQKFPQHSKSYKRIKTDLLDVIDKKKAYYDAKCAFESYSYLVNVNATYNGNDNGAYEGICRSSYMPEATKKINEIVTACKTVDEIYNLPCVY